jgi:hypothetical protein
MMDRQLGNWNLQLETDLGGQRLLRGKGKKEMSIVRFFGVVVDGISKGARKAEGGGYRFDTVPRARSRFCHVFLLREEQKIISWYIANAAQL